MARFRNIATGVVVNVDDSKADRYAAGWGPADESADAPVKKAAAKKAPAKKSTAKK